MLVVPLNPVASQTLNMVLDQQPVQIAVYQKRTGLYFDLLLNGVAVVTTVLCQNITRLAIQTYSGFIGDFAFFDTQGDTPPAYLGLGARYQLLYLQASDL